MGASFFHVENMPKTHYVIASNHSHKPTSVHAMKSKSSSAYEKSNSYSEDEDSEDDDSTFKFGRNTATKNRTDIFDCESSSSSSSPSNSSSSNCHAMTIKKRAQKRNHSTKNKKQKRVEHEVTSAQPHKETANLFHYFKQNKQSKVTPRVKTTSAPLMAATTQQHHENHKANAASKVSHLVKITSKPSMATTKQHLHQNSTSTTTSTPSSNVIQSCSSAIAACRNDDNLDVEVMLINKLGLANERIHNKAQSEKQTALKSVESGKPRCRYLSKDKFDQFKWLRWDSGKKTAYCGICSNAVGKYKMPLQLQNLKHQCFVSGMSNWKHHCTPCHLREHDDSTMHRNSVLHLQNRLLKDSSVENQIHEHAKTDHTKCMALNRGFVARMIIAIYFLAINALPFYGDKSNEGKLPNLLRFLGVFDEKLRTHHVSQNKTNVIRNLQPKNTSFFVERMHDQVVKVIHEEANEALCLCIIVDEWSCKHSNKEHCSVSLRMIDKKLRIKTRFFGFHYLDRVNAQTIVNKIVEVLSDNYPSLNFDKLMIQTYDGAATMQGKHAGVQAILRRDHARHALPMHCTNHRLNLGAKSVTNHNRLIEDAVGACQLLMKIFKYSPKRNAHFEKIKAEIKEDDRRNIQRDNGCNTIRGMILHFSITRWTTRKDSFRSLIGNYYPICRTLCETMSTPEHRRNLNSDHKMEIVGLIGHLQKFRFFFGLFLAHSVFERIDVIATMLQGDEICISKSMHYLDKLKSDLESDRDKEFDNFWSKVQEERENANETFGEDEALSAYREFDGIGDGSIEEEVPRNLRGAMRDLPAEEGSKACWKECYVETYDCTIDQIDQKTNCPLLLTFKEMENTFLRGVINDNDDDYEPSIGDILRNYGSYPTSPFVNLTAQVVKEEIKFVKKRWRRCYEKHKHDKPRLREICDDVMNMASEDMSNEDYFFQWEINAPNLLKMIALLRVAAGTSSYAERTFSLSRKIKNWLRCHMSDNIFNALGMLAWYNKEELDKIVDFKKIANLFVDEVDGRKASYGTFTKDDFPDHLKHWMEGGALWME